MKMTQTEMLYLNIINFKQKLYIISGKYKNEFEKSVHYSEFDYFAFDSSAFELNLTNMDVLIIFFRFGNGAHIKCRVYIQHWPKRMSTACLRQLYVCEKFSEP